MADVRIPIIRSTIKLANKFWFVLKWSTLLSKMVAKKVVSKPVYWTFNILFHSFCFTGLIWQLTQVSIVYFNYEVVSDVKIIMPEKNGFKKYLNICFRATQTIRYEQYRSSEAPVEGH